MRSCTAQGVDASIITNAYDLEIDKECIAYEKSLNESNEQMAATVRNAQGVLQKARLMVAKSKNEYDMRGCINALDACMQDEFVCGSDYENCLDPSGRYIVNGEIVVGSQPGHAIDPELAVNVSSVMTSDVCDINLYRTWDFSTGSCQGYNSTYDGPKEQGNAWGAGTNDTLANYIAQTVTTDAPKNASVNMSQYLQNKIGYVDGDKNFGMCVGVLNKCQDYTYTGTGTNARYNPVNDVVKQYLGRVLIQIKAKQDEVLSEYAESCITDVTSCLAQNGYPTEEPLDENGSSQWTGSEQTQANIAINACRATIVTCMSVNGYSIATPTPGEMNCWVMGLQFNTTTSDCASYTGGTGNNSGGGSGYTVNFRCGSGTENVPSQATTGSITLPKTGCTTPANHTFTGWDCDGEFHAYNTSYTPTSDTTCIAHYVSTISTPTYNVTFYNGSNLVSNCTTTYTAGTQTTVSCTILANNFSKWCPASECGGSCSSGMSVTISANTTDNLTYYACFSQSAACNTYTEKGPCEAADCKWCNNSCLNASLDCSSAVRSSEWSEALESGEDTDPVTLNP